MNKKKVLSVSIDHEGRHEGKVIPGKHLTIGESYDCDIVATLPGLPKGRFNLLEKSRKGYVLKIFNGMEGIISTGGSSLSIRDLIESRLLKKKGDSYLFYLPEDKECAVSTGGLTLRLAYREITVPDKRAVRVDASFRKPWLTREDYSFISVLVISAIIHLLTVVYLNTREIKKKEGIEKIPARFARLILEPPRAMVEKKVETKPMVKPEEEIKKEEEAPKPKEEKKAAEEAPKQAPEVAAKEEAPLPFAPKTREAIQAKVKTRGLLGVIMAKKREGAVRGEDVFRKAHSVLQNIDRGKSTVDAGEDFSSISASGEPSEVALGVSGAKGKDTKRLLEERKGASLLEKEGAGRKKEDDKALLRQRDEAEVYKTVRSYIGGLKYIYNNALRKDPTLKGKVIVRILISPDGKVLLAELVSATLKDTEVTSEILRKIQKWRFQELRGGEEFAITYTFDFSPVG